MWSGECATGALRIKIPPSMGEWRPCMSRMVSGEGSVDRVPPPGGNLERSDRPDDMWKRKPPDNFTNRRDAGRKLALQLKEFARLPGLLVLGLPRGGVPVAYEVARELKAPLDVMLVRKLGLPGQEELAMGAIASGGHRIFNSRVVEHFGPDPGEIEGILAREEEELERREQLYRNDRDREVIRGRSVILVDDGLATGATMCVAARAVRAESPARLIIAVPVAAAATAEAMHAEADDVCVCSAPKNFTSVGEWYVDFSPTEDEEVIELLRRAGEPPALG